MKLSNRQLEALSSAESGSKLYAAKFPVRVGWKIKLQREALTGVARALQSARQELIERYCDRDKKGTPLLANSQYSFHGDNAKRFITELEELMVEEVEVQAERVVIPEAVFDAAGSWSANDLEVLAPFIDIKQE
jgi:hypothetical protein